MLIEGKVKSSMSVMVSVRGLSFKNLIPDKFLCYPFFFFLSLEEFTEIKLPLNTGGES